MLVPRLAGFRAAGTAGAAGAAGVGLLGFGGFARSEDEGGGGERECKDSSHGVIGFGVGTAGTYKRMIRHLRMAIQ
jgi:hypothetical protein